MARIRQITARNDVPAEKRHIFDAIAGSRGSVRGPFSALMNSPEVAGRTGHLGEYLRFETSLSPQELELAVITTSREFDSSYEWSAHSVLALKAGVRDEAVETVANRGALESLTRDEALIVGYVRELLREHKVSDATYRAAMDRFGEQGLTDLTATVGYYAMLACVLNAFEVEQPPGTPVLP